MSEKKSESEKNEAVSQLAKMASDEREDLINASSVESGVEIPKIEDQPQDRLSRSFDGTFVPVGYVEMSHFRKFDKSLCDKSQFVPLTKQISDIVKGGYKPLSAAAYDFPADTEIKYRVSLEAITRLRDIGLDLSEISDIQKELMQELNDYKAKIEDAENLRQINKALSQLESGNLVDVLTGNFEGAESINALINASNQAIQSNS